MEHIVQRVLKHTEKKKSCDRAFRLRGQNFFLIKQAVRETVVRHVRQSIGELPPPGHAKKYRAVLVEDLAILDQIADRLF